MVEGRLGGHACVFNGEGDEFQCSPMFLDGRYEGGVFSDLGFEYVFTSNVPRKSDLDDNYSAELLVEGDRIWEGGVGYLAYMKSGDVP